MDTMTIVEAASMAKWKRGFIYPEGLDEEERHIFWDGERFNVIGEDMLITQDRVNGQFDIPTFTMEEATMQWVFEEETCDESESIIHAMRSGNLKWQRDQQAIKDAHKKKLHDFAAAGVKIVPGGLKPEPLKVKTRKLKKETP